MLILVSAICDNNIFSPYMSRILGISFHGQYVLGAAAIISEIMKRRKMVTLVVSDCNTISWYILLFVLHHVPGFSVKFGF